jgi:hypothetical protein
MNIVVIHMCPKVHSTLKNVCSWVFVAILHVCLASPEASSLHTMRTLFFFFWLAAHQDVNSLTSWLQNRFVRYR